MGSKYCHYSFQSTISCKIFYLLFLSPCHHHRHEKKVNISLIPSHGWRRTQHNCSVSHFWVPGRYWSAWLTINTRLINILVFLMFLLHSKYHSLSTIADVLLLAAVVPSVVVQLVCSIYISPVSFGIFGSSSCVGRFLSVHCDLVCVRVSFVDFNCYRFDSSFQILLGCCVMLQACL